METTNIKELAHICDSCNTQFNLRVGDGYILRDGEIDDATIYIDSPRCPKCGKDCVRIAKVAEPEPQPEPVVVPDKKDVVLKAKK